MKASLFPAIVAGSLLPFLASAATPQSIASALATTAYGVAGALVLIGWVVAGGIYLTSWGNESKMETGKHAIYAAVVGTLLVILATGAVALVKNTFGV